MKLEAEAVDAFGRGGAQFPIINRYAERVLAEYDSAAIPDMFEVFVYEMIIGRRRSALFSPRTSTSRARTCWVTPCSFETRSSGGTNLPS